MRLNIFPKNKIMKNPDFVVIILVLATAACSEPDAELSTITQRIQYDVTIKSPDPGLDWWVQNIEGMRREALVNDLLEAAYKGKIRAYDPFLLSKLSPDQVQSIGSRNDTIRIQRPEPPYEYFDTVITQRLNIHDITRLRFLEEWNLNEKNMKISKEVHGIAPMLESYDKNGILRGYQPMFWIFFDQKYPAALEGRVL
jgi:hypothetical protein